MPWRNPMSNLPLVETTSDNIEIENTNENKIVTIYTNNDNDENIEIESEEDIRRRLLEMAAQYHPIGKLSKTTPYDKMTISQLEDHVELLRINNGGTPIAAKILTDIQNDYRELLSSDEVRRRLAIVEAKGARFVEIAQKLERLIGGEITVKAMKFEEYHSLLKTLSSALTIISFEITKQAELLGIKLPIDELATSIGDVPVIEGMPLDEQSIMYILRNMTASLEHWHNIALSLRSNIQKLEATVATQQQVIEAQKIKLNEDAVQRNQFIQSYTDKFTEIEKYFIKASFNNGFLALIDPDEKLNKKNLTFTADIREALFLTNKRAAQRIIEVLSETNKYKVYTFTIHRLAYVSV